MNLGELLGLAVLAVGGTWLLVFILRRAKALHYLFPPHDKVAVFLMTVGLLGVFVLYADVAAVATAAVGNIAKAPLGGLILATVVVITIVAGLSLPFTTADVRGLATSLVAVNAVLLVAANAYYALTHPGDRWNALNWLFAWYWGTWVFTIRGLEDDEIINDRATAPRRARIAGAACIAMLVAAKLLDVPWIWAYVFTVAIATTFHRALDRVLGEARA